MKKYNQTFQISLFNNSGISQKHKIGVATASAIVIANMIGTGVFTSVGFQLAAVQNTYSILSLWILGGLIALCGAFVYAELGTRFRESGGDYIYLSRTLHPVAGFLSAWAGLTAGFSAPVALAAIAFTKYMAPLGLQYGKIWAVGIIIVIGLMHSFTIRHSSRFQNLTTIIKIVFIVFLIIAGLFIPSQGENAILMDQSWTGEIFSSGYAVSMVFVFFAYTGWNAASYVTDEIKNPEVNLPRALILSTVFVAFVYVLFQFVLLKHGSLSDLQGKEEVSFISFQNAFGSQGGKWVSIFIAIQLIATISSYLWVGPRVTWAMANENRLWKKLAMKNSQGIPVPALWLHIAVSVILTVSGTFENILLYCGFVLQMMSSLTVLSGLLKKPEPGTIYKIPFRPWPHIIFLVFNVWVLVFTLLDRTMESLIGLLILGVGAILYFAGKERNKGKVSISK